MCFPGLLRAPYNTHGKSPRQSLRTIGYGEESPGSAEQDAG